MLKKKILGVGLATLLSVSALLPMNVFAAENDMQTLKVTSEGIESSMMKPTWVSPGKNVQYPSQGGTWEYGFWNVKYRSYYTVKRCHGSTVISGDRKSRSVDTASGRTSIAELWAINNPGADPHYYYRVCN